MKKIFVIILMFISFLGFSLPILNPSPDVVNEGTVQVVMVSSGSYGLRYGLFGIMEVGYSSVEGDGYLKIGFENLLGVPLKVATTYGYLFDGTGFVVNGILGYEGEKVKVSGGMMFSKSQEYSADSIDLVDLYELNPFVSLNVKIDNISNVNIEANFPVYTSNSSASRSIPSLSLYATQKYDNVFFYKYAAIYGGIKYDFATVKILFGVSGEIELIKNPEN
ncbi:hypothetical protein SAMN02745164_01937 [Marinitoga hydrogenitolerans DSM 16785]|uniref:Outer membrane protein beta-barrel domain-containing protein n=1 Tax=Marinitoga hydrogenitolerans (strain DSM 16785 / JCM 12826 / AT1271) TaxID=1122195 RepID=A0A1M4ZHR1_MARH1|nr:hypothetical protein [Marinitoga hydrogenitolerans]SHF17574.1 hypothetical protein SAMN02745164_01937 [Marinitoga hydrogenitolerans DSM 16785]